MLGTITNQTGNTNSQVFTEIKSLERKINGIETQVNNLQTEVDSFGNNITTENLNSTNIISQSINANAVSGTSISSETLTSDSIISDNIISDNINADSITAETLTSDEIHGQIKDRQSTITSDTGNITTLDSEDIDVDLLKAKAATITELTLEDSLNTTDVTATNVNADNITGTNGNITNLQSEEATIDEITNTSITSHTATIDSIDAEEAEIDKADIGTLKADEIESAVITGKEVVNLDPQKLTDQDYYLLKIKKGFDSLHLFVEDSLDINIINAHTPSNTTDGTPLVISHCNTVSEIVLYSKDDDYYYIEISPNNTNELQYSYKAHSKIENLITASLNEEVEFDWYYKTERTSEIIFLGSAGEEERFNYQFTILGKLNALVSPTFENTVFDDITVNKNLFTKDYFNEDTQGWAYKKGEVNDYLSNIEDYIDEETGEQKTRIDWRKRVAFRQPNQYIVTTEDSTEDVLVDDTKVGERVVKANVNTLMDLGTLRNYNGQWKAGEPVPVDTHDFKYYNVDDPDDVAEGFSFLGTPVIEEDSLYPDAELSQKIWTFTPTDSWTIYTTVNDYRTWAEIQDLMVESTKDDSLVTTIAVDADSTYTRLQTDVDYTIVPTSSIKQVATINVGDDFENDILATGLFEEIAGEYYPTQTIFLEDETDKGVFDTNAVLSHFFGYSYFSVFVNGNEYTFSGDVKFSTLKSTPATTVNPITKLGVVDEGTWVAGDVTTPHLTANESTVLNKTTTINNDLHITEDVLDFGGTNYNVWDYANDNMNWVEE